MLPAMPRNDEVSTLHALDGATEVDGCETIGCDWADPLHSLAITIHTAASCVYRFS